MRGLTFCGDISPEFAKAGEAITKYIKIQVDQNHVRGPFGSWWENWKKKNGLEKGPCGGRKRK